MALETAVLGVTPVPDLCVDIRHAPWSILTNSRRAETPAEEGDYENREKLLSTTAAGRQSRNMPVFKYEDGLEEFHPLP